MAFFSIFKQGQIYLNTWPQEAKLGIIFPENRIMKATSFAQKFMPFVAVFAILWQQIYAKNDLMAFSIAILTALIIRYFKSIFSKNSLIFQKIR